MSLSDMFMFLNDADNYEERKVCPKETVHGIIVSTALTSDCGYETAVGDKGENFHPVERYDTQEEAFKGHTEWVKRIQDGQRSFTKLGWLGIIEDGYETIIIPEE